jgi:hypothetical protein
MNAKQQIKLIEKTWSTLDYVFGSLSWGQYGKNYLKENIEEEKNHRSYMPANVKSYLTIGQASKLFAVQQLVKYLFTSERPSLEGYHYSRKSIYTAYSLAKQYQKELCIALLAQEGFSSTAILDIDYAQLQSLGY